MRYWLTFAFIASCSLPTSQAQTTYEVLVNSRGTNAVFRYDASGNFLGETRTLTLAIYTALQTPGGEAVAARLVAVSLALAVAALALAEWSNRRLRAWLHAPC